MADDPFDVLGIRDDAGESDIRAAYVDLAKRHHPDAATGDAAAFRRVRAAYETLSDPRLRRDAVEARVRRGTASPSKGMSGFDGFFDDMSRTGRGRDISRPVPMRGEDIHRTVEISLEQAFAGGTFPAPGIPCPCEGCAATGRVGAPGGATCEACGGAGRSRKGKGVITVEVSCPDCTATGRVDWRRCADCLGTGQGSVDGASFDVPPGVEDGFEVRLVGLGGHGANGGRSGDAFLTVRTARHGVFARKGPDLAMRLRIPVWKAALGGTVDYAGMDGRTRPLEIRPGTDGGTRLRVAGGGMPAGDGRGSLFVTLDVEVPDASAGEMRAAFERVRALDAAAAAGNRPGGAGSGR